MVAGKDTGIERMNGEWLLQIPRRIEGPIRNAQGETVTSHALTNRIQAWGLNLPFLRDQDEDGFPDKMDPAPKLPGYRDGER